MKIKLLVLAIFIPILVASCNKSGSNNATQTSYSGPSECLVNKSANLTESIVGGTLVTNSTVPSGNNTVAILLNSKNGGGILCSGTVVANNLILTAGHCFDDVDQSSTSPGLVVFRNAYNSYNSSNSATISCWQRPTRYVPCSANNSYNCILNDITWVKINGNANSFGYNIVSILSNPQTISNTESKWMIGFGELNDNTSNNGGNKYIVESTAPYADQTPSGSTNTFDSLTFPNAYEQYLTVIGPNLGKGTCEGDSGGPVYVARPNGSANYVLAALTQGSNNLLSPHPTNTGPTYTFDTSNYASCNDGYGVYTTIGNYVSWITSTSGVSLSTY
jgi:secreted trypsin-like serine protease